MRLLVPLLLAGVGAAQATFPHVVLTELPGGTTRAQLVAIDPGSGAATPLAGFASDAQVPLAVTIDPYDGDLLVALAAGSGQSAIVRLDAVGGALAEFPLATLPGPVVDLTVLGGDLLVAVDAPGGGLYRAPRRGGPAALVLAQPNLTAMQAYGPAGSVVTLAWTGRPGTAQPDSGTGLFDVGAGAFVFGPHAFPNPTGRVTTGVVDLPTGVPRQVLAFDDGAFALFAGLLGPGLMPIATTPAIPPGGAVALHAASPYSVAPLGLGGAAHPFLYELDPWSGTVTRRSAALPGAPVDVAPGLERIAISQGYGAPCGAVALAHVWSGLPQLGASVVSTVHGPANALVLLAGGLDDFAAGLLPATLPGGCPLEVAPDVVLALVTGATGFAQHALTIPPVPTLVGATAFLQWAHYDAAGLSTSAAAAHRIGP